MQILHITQYYMGVPLGTRIFCDALGSFNFASLFAYRPYFD